MQISLTDRSIRSWMSGINWLRYGPGYPGEVLPENLGGGERPASWSPYASYDQILRFSLTYLWSDQKFNNLFITWLLNEDFVSDQPYN